MADETEDLQKSDLLTIRKLHQKIDYSSKSNLKVIYDYAMSKELLKTKIGVKYLTRLLSLYEGKTENSACIICGESCEDNPVFCNICNHKLLCVNQDQKTKVTKEVQEKDKSSIVTEVISNKSLLNVKTDYIQPIKKRRVKKTVSFVVIILLFLYIIGRVINFKENPTSSATKNNVTSVIEQDNGSTTITQDDISLQTKQINGTSNSAKDKEPTKSEDQIMTDGEIIVEDGIIAENAIIAEDKLITEQDIENEYFNFTEDELMGQIQDVLAKYDLDIGTKEGYPHIFFVIDHDTASNIVYQIALNENGKVHTVSVNISAPVDDLEMFSEAVTSAIITCDSTITKGEMSSLMDNIQNNKIITMNGISYFAGVLTENILTYSISKASVPDVDVIKSNSKESNIAEQETYELSPLVGTTSDEVQSKLGTPISFDYNTEYYSDILSIVYENGVAYKIILGLDDRFDFTQIGIPNSTFAIKNIQLRDTEEAVLNNATDTSLFINDGVFYGNTYQIEQDGYYVNVDYFTLQNIEGCPVYRIVLTRLNPIE